MPMHYWGGWGGDYYGAGYGTHDWWLGMLPLIAGPLFGFIMLLIVWSIFWKGLALWHAARRGQYWWFIIMLVLNTAGILEIIYLFFVAKLKWAELFEMREHHHH